jgi:uncharacterized tellurite resistance protein B-like protein
MLSAIRALFSRSENTERSAPIPDPSVDPVHLAACALLLDIAWSDGEFSDAERRHLEDVLSRHFGLSEADSTRLLQLADEERRGAIDHFRFTSVLKKSYDLGQKMVLAEVMWGLVLSDGKVAEHEHYLSRKIANLLDLEPAYLSSAKQLAAEKLERGNG